MTQSGKRKSGMGQTSHNGEPLHLFVLARVHELNIIAERCANPLVKAPASVIRIRWWRRFLRETQ
jgi:hypothetical protein